jgi:hypothetical protein
MTNGEQIERGPSPTPPDGAAPADEMLAALLHDLVDLRDYLVARGQHTYELAQRFLQNARRDTPDRAYDERQATMLEYQNYIWHEIGGRVDQLLARYGDTMASVPGDQTAASGSGPHPSGTMDGE